MVPRSKKGLLGPYMFWLRQAHQGGPRTYLLFEIGLKLATLGPKNEVSTLKPPIFKENALFGTIKVSVGGFALWWTFRVQVVGFCLCVSLSVSLSV